MDEDYDISRPEIGIIKDCMQVLDKCPDVIRKTYDDLEEYDEWMRIYIASTNTRSSAIIKIVFQKKYNVVEIRCYAPQHGFVDLK
jgi:flavorubredoxin